MKLFALVLCGCAILVGTPYLYIRYVGGEPLPPDIVVIIADDISLEDLELLPTPNIDRIRADGVSFSRAYSMPTCAPTRLSLFYGDFTPRHFRSACRDNPNAANPHPLAAPLLSPARKSLPDVLAAAGYSTLLVGKFHTGTVSSGWQNAPVETGYGNWRAGGPAQLAATGGPCNSFSFVNWQRVDDGVIIQETTYATTAQTDATLAWASATLPPRFACVSYHTPHIPLHVPPGETGTTDRELFEAMVRDLDREVGRLLDAIQPTAYVFFFADNGTFGGNAAPGEDPDKMKKTTFEGGINVPFLARGPGIPAGTECAELICTTDLYATLEDIVGQPLSEDADDTVSLLPLLLDPSSGPVRLMGYAGHHRDNNTFRDQATFTLTHKLRRVFGVETLFNLEADPEEESPLDPLSFPVIADPLRDYLDSVWP